jgi:4-hydroxyphenylacetate 3-monooxygenase
MPARRGNEYLQSLNDGRALYVRGEKVADVTTHPAFREAARTLAGIFDLHHDPRHRETLTYRSPTSGDPVSIAWLMPQSTADLVRRREANRLVAEQTHGMITRTPNLLAQIVTQWAMNREIFDAMDRKFGDAVCAYYEHCRENDVALTHAIVSPQYDRSKGLSQQEDPDLVVGLVKQDSEGIVVRGTRMLATHAHFSNEVVVWPFDRLTEADTRYALWFACPLNAKGVTLISRQSYADGRNVFDSPLASRFDEMDAAIIFDDVKQHPVQSHGRGAGAHHQPVWRPADQPRGGQGRVHVCGRERRGGVHRHRRLPARAADAGRDARIRGCDEGHGAGLRG